MWNFPWTVHPYSWSLNTKQERNYETIMSRGQRAYLAKRKSFYSLSNWLLHFRSNGLQVVALMSVLFRSFVLSICSNFFCRQKTFNIMKIIFRRMPGMAIIYIYICIYIYIYLFIYNFTIFYTFFFIIGQWSSVYWLLVYWC